MEVIVHPPLPVAAALALAVAAGTGLLESQTQTGPEFRISAPVTKQQREPAVAADGNGNFVVVWSMFNGVFWVYVDGARFDAAGAPLSGEFRVSSGTSVYEVQP